MTHTVEDVDSASSGPAPASSVGAQNDADASSASAGAAAEENGEAMEISGTTNATGGAGCNLKEVMRTIHLDHYIIDLQTVPTINGVKTPGTNWVAVPITADGRGMHYGGLVNHFKGLKSKPDSRFFEVNWGRPSDPDDLNCVVVMLVEPVKAGEEILVDYDGGSGGNRQGFGQSITQRQGASQAAPSPRHQQSAQNTLPAWIKQSKEIDEDVRFQDEPKLPVEFKIDEAGEWLMGEIHHIDTEKQELTIEYFTEGKKQSAKSGKRKRTMKTFDNFEGHAQRIRPRTFEVCQKERTRQKKKIKQAQAQAREAEACAADVREEAHDAEIMQDF